MPSDTIVAACIERRSSEIMNLSRARVFLLFAVLAASLGATLSTLSTGEAIAGDPPANKPPAGPTAEQIAARIQSFYSTTKTFSASFTQVYRIKKQGITKRASGKVVFSKPGKMAWTYDDPSGNRVVSDGTTLRAYDRESARMYEQPADRTPYPSALAFLVGQGDLARSFTLRVIEPEKLKFPGGHVLEGIPKDASPAYQRVYFFVDAETAQVRRVVFVDAQANQNRFDFTAPSINTAPEEGAFTLRPPSGTLTVRPQIN